MTEGLVVVGVDGSPASTTALQWALEMAARYGDDVVALHAWQWDFHGLGVLVPDTPVPLAVAASHAAQAQLEKALADRPAGAPEVSARARTVEGDAAAALIAAAGQARLLVLGRHGQSALHRRLLGPTLGSVAGFALSRSPVPVAVIPPEAAAEAPRRVVVGVDGSASSARALRWAQAHAATVGAPLVAVLSWQLTTLPPPAAARAGGPVPPIDEWQREAEQLLATTVRRALGEDAAVEQQVLHRPAADGLLGAVTASDLLVVGDRGRGGFARLLLGSVSRQCVEHAACPVVVVPAPDRAATA